MDTLEELLHWLIAENGSVGILGTHPSCHAYPPSRRNQFNARTKENDSRPRQRDRGPEHTLY